MSTRLARHVLGIFIANGVELAEKRRSSLTVRVEEDVFEESSHKMQVVKAETTCMSLFSQKQNDLPEVVADETFIRVPRETPEGEADQLLKQEEVLLLVVVELMKRVKLVGSVLEADDQVAAEK